MLSTTLDEFRVTPDELALIRYTSATQSARLMVASAQQLLTILQIQGSPLAPELATIVKRLQSIEESIDQENTIAFDWREHLAA